MTLHSVENYHVVEHFADKKQYVQDILCYDRECWWRFTRKKYISRMLCREKTIRHVAKTKWQVERRFAEKSTFFGPFYSEDTVGLLSRRIAVGSSILKVF